jgi:hypothetical protein
MTGSFVRIRRGDAWANVEIDQLTDEELDRFFKKNPADAERWAKLLAAWIRDNCKSEPTT